MNGSSGQNCEIKKLNSTIFKDSTILTNQKSIELINLLNLNQTNVSIALLYQASRDGFNPQSFHSKCNGVLGTLTLVKTDNGNIFGGFTKANWFSSVGYSLQYDDSAFLFSLVNSYNITAKMNINNPNNAITAADYLGPMYGYETICDLCFSNQDLSFGSSSVGQNYQLPSFPNDPLFLAGVTTFKASQIEVFSLI